jgi:putative (di)nucleoside polyphosphate hydrolase
MPLYRKCVGIVLKKKDKIFTGLRIDTQDAWQLPQGGIEEGETFIEAAKRELFEETNIISIKFLGISETYAYSYPKSVLAKIIKQHGNVLYIGQEITFVAFRFIGLEDEICLTKAPQEFTQWKWVSSTELLCNIVDFKAEPYNKAIQYFKQTHIIA